MDAKALATNIGRTIQANAPTILTAVAAAGVVSTAIFSATGAMKAQTLLREDCNERAAKGDENFWKLPPFKEQVKLTWKCYVPAIVIGSMTIACVVGSNRLSSTRQAALASAYSVAEKTFTEYKTQVVEQLGAKGEQEVRDKIAERRMQEDPVSSREVIMITGKEVLCYESYSGRYFQSDVETLRKAQNDINAQINNSMYASLNEFYLRIGLPPTSAGEEVGFTADNTLELRFSTMLSDDGRPCICVGFDVLPTGDFYNFK